MHLQILDLDGSVSTQRTLPGVLAWTSVGSIPLRDPDARLRLWSPQRHDAAGAYTYCGVLMAIEQESRSC